MKYEYINAQETAVMRFYYMTFESDEKEVEVSVCVNWADNQPELTNIEFLTEINEEDKQEISDWIWDNLGEW